MGASTQRAFLANKPMVPTAPIHPPISLLRPTRRPIGQPLGDRRSKMAGSRRLVQSTRGAPEQ